MQVTGKLKEIGSTQRVNDRFSKLRFVLIDNSIPDYQQFLPIELYKEKMILINSFAIDDTVRVTFTIKGRQWTAPDGTVKYIITLVASEIEKV
jgi:hypothetical protein